MTAKFASGFTPSGGPGPGFADCGLPRPLRYRSVVSASSSRPTPVGQHPDVSSMLRRVVERLSGDPESVVVAVLGFGASVYLGLYLGVVLGADEILRESLAESVAPVDLLESLIRLLAGWIVFLFIGLVTSMVLWHRLSVAEQPEPPAELRDQDKEHVLGYD